MKEPSMQHQVSFFAGSLIVVMNCGLLSCGSRSAWAAPDSPAFASTAEEWGMEEISLHSGRVYKNPFTDVRLQAQFSGGDKRIVVEGFYDGDGTWKVRLMPEAQGHWTFRTMSNNPDLNGKAGAFTV